MIGFLVGPLVAGLWLAWKAWKSSFPLPVRLALAALALAVSQSFQLQRHFFGSLAGPNVSFWPLVLLDWAFASLVIIFMLSAAWDLCAAVYKGIRAAVRTNRKEEDTAPPVPAGESTEAPSMSRRSFLAGSAVTSMHFIMPVSAAAAAAGVHSAVSVPELRSWDIYLPGLPAEMDGLRLIHMADLHIGPLWKRDDVSAIVETVNNARPDLICVTGDLADGDPGWRCADDTLRKEAAWVFSGLKSRLGVWACTGNHEYFSNYAAWMEIWKGCRINFLHNDSVTLQPGGKASLVLGGLDDPVSGPRGNPFAHAPEPGPDNFRLLMDHRPMSAKANARRGTGLQLSGHTHGGQIPGLDLIVARANRGFVRGWYTVDNMALYVTSGASQWSGFAVRLGIPPEIALLTLRATTNRRSQARKA